MNTSGSAGRVPSAASSSRHPRALGPGARVALVAPAGPVSEERIEASIERCRLLGLNPVPAPSARRRERYLAGSDAERLNDLQSAFDDPRNDAIWALRGGYGSLRILSQLNLDRQRRDPVPFIGFSDNTTIHQLHVGIGVISFHGPHPGADFPQETELSFLSCLFTDDPPGPLPLRPSDPSPRPLRSGLAEGAIVGGNLTLLAALSGSKERLVTQGKILLLEDVGEPPYRIDRMLRQLEREGAFIGVAGLAVGRILTPEPADAEGIVLLFEELAEQLNVPAVMNLPVGHLQHNCTIPIGGQAVLDGGAGSLILTEGSVRRG